MSKKQWLLAGGAALALVIVLAAWQLGGGEEEGVELLVQPERGSFRVTVTTTGELQAQNSVQIMGPAEARRVGIHQMELSRLVPEGTLVEEGDFVAALDPSELQTRMQEAQLNVDQAQSQYTQTRLDTSLTLSEARNRLIDLAYAVEEAQLRYEQAEFEPPSVQRQAEIDKEKAERALEQARENYQTQEAQATAQMQEVGTELRKVRNELDALVALRERFTVHAPAPGMVIYHRSWSGEKLTTGGTVRAWDPVVAELPDLSQMKSVTYVNEVDVQQVQPGLPVEIGLDALPDVRLHGEVVDVANIGEEHPTNDSKVFQVEIMISETDSTLRPAMTTSNTIVVATVPDALTVPLETLHAADSLHYVFVKNGRGVERRQVALGRMNQDAAVVTAGLSEDDELYLSLPPDTTGLPLVRLDADS